jgi:hypothetical protein
VLSSRAHADRRAKEHDRSSLTSRAAVTGRQLHSLSHVLRAHPQFPSPTLVATRSNLEGDAIWCDAL